MRHRYGDRSASVAGIAVVDRGVSALWVRLGGGGEFDAGHCEDLPAVCSFGERIEGGHLLDQRSVCPDAFAVPEEDVRLDVRDRHDVDLESGTGGLARLRSQRRASARIRGSLAHRWP